jgi:membrane protein insertase, YidC/Oxa1 family, N-terminal domain
MNQTRTLLFFALMFVAYMLWTQWEQDYGPKPPAAQPVAAAQADGKASADGSVPGAAGTANVPADTSATPAGKAELVTIQNDVLRLTIDTRGGSVVRSELLYYPNQPVTRKDPTPPPVRLLDDDAKTFFAAQDGLVSNTGAAPDHRALFHAEKTQAVLADGEKSVSLDLTWSDPSGVKVTKRYTLKRMDYVVDLDQRIDNGSQATWTGNAYQQLQRAPAEKASWFKAYTDPAQHSFFGAGWYSPDSKFESLNFPDFQKKPLNRAITGGWISMLQHYFLVAWIPPASENVSYSTTIVDPNSATPRYLVRAFGPAISVAPGQATDSVARLYVGPRLQGTLDAIAPGLDLTANYGWLTIIATPLHWLLSQLHAISGNWGVAIILLVLLIKTALYKLTDAQFRSGARMRKLQPRVQALKERYGDDRMKMQQAMMELYKKGEGESDGGLPAHPHHLPDLHRPAPRAFRIDRTAPRAVLRLDPRSFGARSVLRAPGAVLPGHAAHPAHDADGGHGSDPGQDDEGDAADLRYLLRLLPGGPRALLDRQRCDQPAPAVVHQPQRRSRSRKGKDGLSHDDPRRRHHRSHRHGRRRGGSRRRSCIRPPRSGDRGEHARPRTHATACPLRGIPRCTG